MKIKSETNYFHLELAKLVAYTRNVHLWDAHLFLDLLNHHSFHIYISRLDI